MINEDWEKIIKNEKKQKYKEKQKKKTGLLLVTKRQERKHEWNNKERKGRNEWRKCYLHATDCPRRYHNVSTAASSRLHQALIDPSKQRILDWNHYLTGINYYGGKLYPSRLTCPAIWCLVITYLIVTTFPCLSWKSASSMLMEGKHGSLHISLLFITLQILLVLFPLSQSKHYPCCIAPSCRKFLFTAPINIILYSPL